MKGFTKLTVLLFVSLAGSAISPVVFAATIDQQTSARLDALERENAALRQRVNRLEASKAAIRHRPVNVNSEPASATTSWPAGSPNLGAENPVVDRRTSKRPPHFELSGSLLYQQPGAGDLEYGTLVTPLPITTPSWSNQSLTPKFSPTFSVGARYMPDESDDLAVSWTHLNTSTNASFSAGPTQMVGPPYLIGPESALYSIGHGAVQSAYDTVGVDGGHTFCAECPFQLRAFGGVEYARIGQNLSGLFQSADGTASSGYTTNSLFNGAGPRLGLKGQYSLGAFQLIGEFAGAALIGISQSHIDFTTVSPALAGVNNQSLTSPNATQLIPSIDARLAVAYDLARTEYGLFKIELGYRAAVYFNAVSQYSLTQVSTTLPPVGVFLATEQHSQSNFTDQGPYLTGRWLF